MEIKHFFPVRGANALFFMFSNITFLRCQYVYQLRGEQNNSVNSIYVKDVTDCMAVSLKCIGWGSFVYRNAMI